ncbi:Hypothetical predicted protein, partial [Pelobates cultripes]
MPVAIPSISHPPRPGRKVLVKAKHSSKLMMDSKTPVTDGANNEPSCKRTSSRAKTARHWKWAKAQPDTTESELSSDEESAPTLDIDQSNDLSDLDSEYGKDEECNPSTKIHISGMSSSDLHKE